MIIGITAYRDRIQYIADNFAGAGAIYSCVRKHRSAYSGSAIRVQRSSDSTQQDIGFGSDGFLDQSALTSFVGGGNGDVVTVYDQSGNGYDITAAASQQWRIVTSGTVNTNGGQPSMVGGASASGFILSTGITASDLMTYNAGDIDHTVLWVGANGSTGSQLYNFQLLTSTFVTAHVSNYRPSPALGSDILGDGNTFTGTSLDVNGAILEIYYDDPDNASYCYIDGVSAGTQTNNPSANPTPEIIVWGFTSSSNAPSELQELIIFNQSHYDSRADLYALISDYYTY